MRSLINAGLPFHSSSAPALGLSDKARTTLTRRGVLRRVLFDVYVDSETADSMDLRATAVALVLPEGAVVCRRTAAWLRGVDAFGPGEQAQRLLVECVVPRGFAKVRRRGVRGFEADLVPEDTVLRRDVPFTNDVRTAVDLARWLKRPHALAAIDAMTHAGLVTGAQMWDYASQFAGYRGIGQARELILLVEPLTESPGESWLRLRLIDAGFPHPEAQIEIRSGGQLIHRLDLGYSELCLGLEYDGLEYHDAAADRDHDERRRERLRRQFGWDVYGFDRGDVLGRRPNVELAVGALLGIEPRMPRAW